MLATPEQFVREHSAEEIAEKLLIPSDYPGNHTLKYFVKEYPGLVVRKTEYCSPEEMAASLAVYQSLEMRGIPNLKTAMFVFQNDPYVVTQKVHGTGVVEAVSGGELELAAADRHWALLTNHFNSCLDRGLPMVVDSSTPEQIMYGHHAYDLEPRLYLVDIDRFNGPIMNVITDYGGGLVEVAASIVDLEAAAKKGKMELSRQAVLQAADERIPKSDSDYRPFGRLIRAMLEEMNSDMNIEEYLEDFR